MKKLLIISICILVLLTCACCKTEQNAPQAQSGDLAGQNSAPENTARPEQASADITREPGEEVQSEDTDKQNGNYEDSKDVASSDILVVCFSATGTTKGVAEKIAEAADADLYEIIPAHPYTEEDLNYNSDTSRTTIEKNDDSARPEITGEVSDWDNYKTVYLGYPIWWGDAPKIMDTFVENYNFQGKTVIPFCTSGGSGVGSSAANLAALANGGNWLEGTRFGGGESEAEIAEWVNKTQ